jgi:hypothetical protein
MCLVVCGGGHWHLSNVCMAAQGPLQGPLWRNPKSKANAHGRAHTPLTPPTRYGFAKRDMSHTNDDSMMVSPVDGQRCAHLHLDARQHAQGGARPPMMQLAFTTVDDLTGWLQHNAHELALDTPGAPPPPFLFNACVASLNKLI